MSRATRRGQMVVLALSRQLPRESMVAMDGLARVTTAANWDELRVLVPIAACTVVVLDTLSGPEALRVADFVARHRQMSVILVTEKDADNARNLRFLPVDEVVWTCELPDGLVSAFRRVGRRWSVPELGAELRNAGHVPQPLRDLLADACESLRVPLSIATLAENSTVNRSTLGRQWNASFPGEPPLRLLDFLSWLRLLRALRAKPDANSWAEVADSMGIHRNTLGRNCMTLTGMSIEAATADPREAERLFTERVVAPLLRIR